MPEGDTLFRAARTLQRALAGRRILHFESVYPALTRVDTDAPIAGRTVTEVTARGKHLLIGFSGDLVLHTHMRMHGSWHIYKPGERWRAPARDLRIRLDTDKYIALAFNVPVAEFLTADALARHERLQALGPDLTDPQFDRQEVRRRMETRGADPIHDVLLDQRVLAGIGNVLKSEVLFVARINPFTPAGSLSDEQFDRLMTASLRLMRLNTVDAGRTPHIMGRRTTGSLNPHNKLFVYGRAGKPCRVCDTAIELGKSGTDVRLTYWCPSCQRERQTDC
ncbi:MAG: DNA-formamidopyrimidine glycosylase family protein [Vicinamibacterales bacterium]